jgi:F-type H+-transporting ATPase subunit delta
VSETTIARVYAETLLREAEKENALGAVEDGMRIVARLLSEEPGFARFLNAPQIEAHGKRSVVVQAFGGHVHPVVVDFLQLVIDKHREPLLERIATAWRALLDRRANRQMAKVTTAVEADRETMERIRVALERATGKEILLETEVDPTLLGGVVVRTGDAVMDASLRTRLAFLGKRLGSTSRG